MLLSLIEMENLDSAWDEEEEGCLPIPPLDDEVFSPYHPTTLALFQYGAVILANLFLCIVSQTNMIKFFDEIDENGNVRDNKGTSCGAREKQQTQGRGKEMKIQIEVLKPVLEIFLYGLTLIE
ncbi:hypothetical protein CK203_063988 [Vitis vinifera]|uniref:Uncharacterized protein n=1 Tax=Vitis vinifera TaxID=29760 RepID=A0A438G563_VITVI|nr:hypothetical protein CK203_063988 [Vitis vinifera]